MDNLDKLLEAIDHPERYSESELRELLSDPEIRQLYRLMSVSRAEEFLHDAPDTSGVDRQWDRFKAKQRRKSFFSWLYNRKAAAVVAVLIASCSIIVVGVSLSDRFLGKSDGQEIDQTALATELPVEAGGQANLQVNDTVIVFEDEKLDKILAEISPYYNVKVDLKYPSSKDVRLFFKWESTTSLPDLIEHLNSFDRINLFLKDDVITDY
ncbi:MAG: DUF4974 domain-containing protein [Muribaculaceae bacterium]|nr:DUF4974 domain-containing protein [Muribaculaceae bacterium]